MTIDTAALRALKAPRSIMTSERFSGGEYQGTIIDPRCSAFYESAHAAVPALLSENDALRAERDGFVALHDRKAEWSLRTFGPGDRYTGVVTHIRKELVEIEAEPSDLTEWCDVILLAMDGAMRSCGASGAELLAALQAKQSRNEERSWPDWRTLKPGDVSEHLSAPSEEKLP